MANNEHYITTLVLDLNPSMGQTKQLNGQTAAAGTVCQQCCQLYESDLLKTLPARLCVHVCTSTVDD